MTIFAETPYVSLDHDKVDMNSRMDPMYQT